MKVFVFLVLALPAAFATMAQDSIWMTPALPHRGDMVTIYFHSDKPAFAHAKKVIGGFYTLDDKNRMVAQDLMYAKYGDNWMATARVPDTMYAVAANVARPDSDALAAAVAAGLDSSNGQPFLKSYLALYFAYTARSRLVGTPEDNERAMACQQQYWDHLSAPLPGFMNKVSWYLRAKKDTPYAFSLLAGLPLDTTAGDVDYSLAANMARQLKNKPLSTLLINVRNQKYPNGIGRHFELQDRMLAATDTAEQRAIIREYKQAYPNEPKERSFLPFLNSLLIRSLESSGDVSGAVALIPEDVTPLDRAGAYNSIAWGAYENNVNLIQALAISRASIDTLKALQSSIRGKPAYETRAQYQKELASNEYAFIDTYASLLYKTGSYKEAFAYAKKSLAASGPRPPLDVIAHYHLFMEKVVQPSKVLASLSFYIAKGESDSAMEAQFKRLYRGPQTADDAYTALKFRGMVNQKAEMVRTIMNEPAAHFTLVNLDGHQVNLDSLKGKTVVIDFWATWCGPCKASFPAMQKLVNHHKDDSNVVFVFIDTQESADNPRQNAADFIKKSDYTFNVLLDPDGKVMNAYKVDGIPTKFVIDKNGMVRFKAVGFDGSTDGTVDEIESMIAVAQKN